ncbi:hypothetical protein M899_0350 [Bacteriovorax sp. BSW11_IV]|uniref:ImmA/IrrE family metallo-endopeptidase n=1 Tax=Bacteriovorax sp. BSW11_IV TaxID=1353529 RepID=UPI000389EE17|nr:hypothetical protein [Bacteriovorax sp. BSW11_IV]EQC50228.1 hypothetical protein M899_0350 [Bacteriovorax sp. BSW11_IV]
MKIIIIALLAITSSFAAISEQSYTELSTEVFGLFKNEFSRLDYPVELELFWKGGLPLAITSFEQEEDPANNHYAISLWGGLARHKNMDEKGWIFSVCHEIGHIIGGAPHVQDEKNSWGSVEGQADFFATSVCLPKYYKNADENELKIIRYETAQSLANFFNESDSEQWASVEVLSKEIVLETILDDYPSNQCRVDTIRLNERLECWFKK